MKYEKRISLKNIAYELGVSVNTVSRALRDCSDISNSTKEKVRKVAIELGYLPNSLLYSINNGKAKTVSLIINNVKNYYFSIMNEKLLYYLKEEGYLANIVCLYGNAFDASIFKECIYNRADTIITFVEPTEETIALVKMNHTRLIMCGRKAEKNFCDNLYTDDIKGGRIAAEYLINQNAKNFVYINVQGSECSKRRYIGFKKELKKKIPNSMLKKINIEVFDEKIDEVLKLPDLGIFAYNDEHLFFVLDKLKQKNVDINKIKFIGYDGISKHISGTLKFPSISFDYDAIAKECIKLVKLEKDGNEKHNSICFDVHLEELE